MQIFVLEDDSAIALGLSYALEGEGYTVTVCKTVQEALATVQSRDFALYILDLTLPDGSGYDVCRAVKTKGDFPVLFLTAFDDEVNVVMGLELG
ncbi:MAG: response regulator, partial [Candidatus Fimenecus sp.]